MPTVEDVRENIKEPPDCFGRISDRYKWKCDSTCPLTKKCIRIAMTQQPKK